MNRSSFIQSLIGLYGIASLPEEMLTHYQKIYLLQCFVRGFQYYQGSHLISQINKIGLLELVREPDNKYDKKAIALHFNKQKIGFIPAESNDVLSVLIDANLLELQAEITHIEPTVASWENVHIAVYAIQPTGNPHYIQNKPYHFLESPAYFTLKNQDETYTRIAYNQKSGYTKGEIFYETMLDHSSNDEVYNLLHENFSNAVQLEHDLENAKFIIDREKLPTNFSPTEFSDNIGSGIQEIESVLGKNNYVEADIFKIAHIPDQIENFVSTTHQTGQRIIEIILKSKL